MLVAGGAGVLGACIVADALRRGARVFVPSRSRERIKRLRDEIDETVAANLTTIHEDVGSEHGVATVRDTICSKVTSLNGVVASLGGWWEGEDLVNLSIETWRRILHDNLTSHYLVARTFLPILARSPGSVYVSMAGIAATKPVAGSGPVSITGAAQRMMTRVLVEEVGTAVRIHEIEVLHPVVTRLSESATPDVPSVTGEDVGAFVTEVLLPRFGEREKTVLSIPAGT